MLMVILDLFPAGVIQFKAIVDYGFWFARSDAFISSGVFESLTWLRGIGASVFFFGGVIPLTWFIVSRVSSLKPFVKDVEQFKEIQEEDKQLESQEYN